MSHIPKRRRGIYLLPNLFTTAALFAGFYAIVAAVQDRYTVAAIAIFVAMVLDNLDGRIARMTNTSSDFGAQYDSLADMVSFGIAPALLMFQWALAGMADLGWVPAKLGWLAAFVYAAAAALRLARFNTQVGHADKRFFQGLPSPPAAALMAGMVWAFHSFGISGQQVLWLAFLITVSAGVLMVSNVLYYSFKDIDFKGRVPFVVLLAVVLIVVLISIDPPKTLFAAAFCYGVSGPALMAWRRWQRVRRRDWTG